MEDEVIRLSKELEKAGAYGELSNSIGGQLLIDWMEQQVNRNIQDMLSKKFVNDHEGYLSARAQADFAKQVVAIIKRAGNPELEKELRARIEDLTNG